PHFDRDYSSIFELLAVPLFGPEQLTQRLAYDETPNDHDPANLTDPTRPKITGTYYDPANPSNPLPAPQGRPSLAGRLFMETDPGVYTADTADDTDPVAGTGLEDDNRWYRVLEYLEVPNRAEEAIRERLSRIVRTPGKINLNTLRDEQALAALVDDPFLMKFDDPNGRMTTTPSALESFTGGTRPP